MENQPPAETLDYLHPQSVRQRKDPVAIASVVCGGLGFLIPVLPSALGVVFGLVGIRNTRHRVGPDRALAITGFALSAASLLLGAIGLIIFLSAMSRAREMANRAYCAKQMQSLGCAMLLHANENRGRYPPGLPELAYTQDITTELFVCRSSDDTRATGATIDETLANITSGGHLSYVYLGQKVTMPAPAGVVLMYEYLANHNDGAHFLFGDGHVEFIDATIAQQIITQLQAGQNPPRLPKTQ